MVLNSNPTSAPCQATPTKATTPNQKAPDANL
jgi:hypothetical protein